MKHFENIKSVYFIGIGGIGMSALARYFMTLGKEVKGYDKTQTELTHTLIKEGIKICFEDTQLAIDKNADLVVYTPAIPSSHLGLNFYKDNNYKLLKRSEVLGLISEQNTAVCVAGSHGKTTVSAMIAHILTESGVGCTAFLGGISVNYNTNYIASLSSAKRKDIVVIEADEFDRSFHRLHPKMAVITSVDTDHLDIYGTKEKIDEAFIEFANKIDEEGFLAIKENQSIESGLPVLDKAFYSLSNTASDVFCAKYWVGDGGYIFTLSYFGEVYTGFRLNIGGYHNIENALAAITIAKELGLSFSEIKSALVTFKGIKRRFEKVAETNTITYIDDYAHHPEEIRVFLESIKELYPKRAIYALFQPHLFSRTKDLAEGFATSLSLVDNLFLLDIYPARELPIEGVTSQLILEKVTARNKSIITKEDFLDKIAKIENGIILTIGAGDIDTLIVPIKNTILKETSQP